MNFDLRSQTQKCRDLRKGEHQAYGPNTSENLPTIHPKRERKPALVKKRIQPTVVEVVEVDEVDAGEDVIPTYAAQDLIPTYAAQDVIPTYAAQDVIPTYAAQDVIPTYAAHRELEPAIVDRAEKKQIQPTVVDRAKDKRIQPTLVDRAEKKRIQPTLVVQPAKKRIQSAWIEDNSSSFGGSPSFGDEKQTKNELRETGFEEFAEKWQNATDDEEIDWENLTDDDDDSSSSSSYDDGVSVYHGIGTPPAEIK